MQSSQTALLINHKVCITPPPRLVLAHCENKFPIRCRTKTDQSWSWTVLFQADTNSKCERIGSWTSHTAGQLLPWHLPRNNMSASASQKRQPPEYVLRGLRMGLGVAITMSIGYCVICSQLRGICTVR